MSNSDDASRNNTINEKAPSSSPKAVKLKRTPLSQFVSISIQDTSAKTNPVKVESSVTKDKVEKTSLGNLTKTVTNASIPSLPSKLVKPAVSTAKPNNAGTKLASLSVSSSLKSKSVCDNSILSPTKQSLKSTSQNSESSKSQEEIKDPVDSILKDNISTSANTLNNNPEGSKLKNKICALNSSLASICMSYDSNSSSDDDNSDSDQDESDDVKKIPEVGKSSKNDSKGVESPSSENISKSNVSLQSDKSHVNKSDTNLVPSNEVRTSDELLTSSLSEVVTNLENVVDKENETESSVLSENSSSKDNCVLGKSAENSSVSIVSNSDLESKCLNNKSLSSKLISDLNKSSAEDRTLSEDFLSHPKAAESTNDSSKIKFVKNDESVSKECDTPAKDSVPCVSFSAIASNSSTNDEKAPPDIPPAPSQKASSSENSSTDLKSQVARKDEKITDKISAESKSEKLNNSSKIIKNFSKSLRESSVIQQNLIQEKSPTDVSVTESEKSMIFQAESAASVNISPDFATTFKHPPSFSDNTIIISSQSHSTNIEKIPDSVDSSPLLEKIVSADSANVNELVAISEPGKIVSEQIICSAVPASTKDVPSSPSESGYSSLDGADKRELVESETEREISLATEIIQSKSFENSSAERVSSPISSIPSGGAILSKLAKTDEVDSSSTKKASISESIKESTNLQFAELPTKDASEENGAVKLTSSAYSTSNVDILDLPSENQCAIPISENISSDTMSKNNDNSNDFGKSVSSPKSGVNLKESNSSSGISESSAANSQIPIAESTCLPKSVVEGSIVCDSIQEPLHFSRDSLTCIDKKHESSSKCVQMTESHQIVDSKVECVSEDVRNPRSIECQVKKSQELAKKPSKPPSNDQVEKSPEIVAKFMEKADQNSSQLDSSCIASNSQTVSLEAKSEITNSGTENTILSSILSSPTGATSPRLPGIGSLKTSLGRIGATTFISGSASPASMVETSAVSKEIPISSASEAVEMIQNICNSGPFSSNLQMFSPSAEVTDPKLSQSCVKDDILKRVQEDMTTRSANAPVGLTPTFNTSLGGSVRNVSSKTGSSYPVSSGKPGASVLKAFPGTNVLGDSRSLVPESRKTKANKIPSTSSAEQESISFLDFNNLLNSDLSKSFGFNVETFQSPLDKTVVRDPKESYFMDFSSKSTDVASAMSIFDSTINASTANLTSRIGEEPLTESSIDSELFATARNIEAQFSFRDKEDSTDSILDTSFLKSDDCFEESLKFPSTILSSEQNRKVPSFESVGTRPPPKTSSSVPNLLPLTKASSPFQGGSKTPSTRLPQKPNVAPLIKSTPFAFFQDSSKQTPRKTKEKIPPGFKRDTQATSVKSKNVPKSAPAALKSKIASSRPTMASPRPSIPSPRPTLASPRASIASPRPSIASPRPSIPSPRPSIPSPRPSISSPRPTIASPRPSITSPRPIAASPKSTITSPKPTIASLQPAVTSPQPTITSPQPTIAFPKNVSKEPKESFSAKTTQVVQKAQKTETISSDPKLKPESNKSKIGIATVFRSQQLDAGPSNAASITVSSDISQEESDSSLNQTPVEDLTTEMEPSLSGDKRSSLKKKKSHSKDKKAKEPDSTSHHNNEIKPVKIKLTIPKSKLPNLNDPSSDSSQSEPVSEGQESERVAPAQEESPETSKRTVQPMKITRASISLKNDGSSWKVVEPSDELGPSVSGEAAQDLQPKPVKIKISLKSEQNESNTWKVIESKENLETSSSKSSKDAKGSSDFVEPEKREFIKPFKITRRMLKRQKHLKEAENTWKVATLSECESECESDSDFSRNRPAFLGSSSKDRKFKNTRVFHDNRKKHFLPPSKFHSSQVTDSECSDSDLASDSSVYNERFTSVHSSLNISSNFAKDFSNTDTSTPNKRSIDANVRIVTTDSGLTKKILFKPLIEKTPEQKVTEVSHSVESVSSQKIESTRTTRSSKTAENTTAVTNKSCEETHGFESSSSLHKQPKPGRRSRSTVNESQDLVSEATLSDITNSQISEVSISKNLDVSDTTDPNLDCAQSLIKEQEIFSSKPILESKIPTEPSLIKLIIKPIKLTKDKNSESFTVEKGPDFDTYEQDSQLLRSDSQINDTKKYEEVKHAAEDDSEIVPPSKSTRKTRSSKNVEAESDPQLITQNLEILSKSLSPIIPNEMHVHRKSRSSKNQNFDNSLSSPKIQGASQSSEDDSSLQTGESFDPHESVIKSVRKTRSSKTSVELVSDFDGSTSEQQIEKSKDTTAVSHDKSPKIIVPSGKEYRTKDSKMESDRWPNWWWLMEKMTDWAWALGQSL